MADAMVEFQERLKERIKGDIGELMPDEVIKQLIEKVVSDEFTKPRTLPNPRYGDYGEPATIMRPALLLEYLQPHLERIARGGIADYLATNPGKLEAIMQDLIGQNMAKLIQKALSGLLEQHFDQFKYKIVQELMNR